MIKSTLYPLITHFTLTNTPSRFTWRHWLVVLWLVVSSLGLAQQCLNYLSVDDTRLSEPAACYFLAQGDTSNAFAELSVLADALGFVWQEASGGLLLERGSLQAVLESTRDIATGLNKRPNALQVAGEDVASPAAIQVADRYYLPVAPVVRAFGGDAYWRSNTRTIHITMPVLEARGASPEIPKTFAPPTPRSTDTATGESTNDVSALETASTAADYTAAGNTTIRMLSVPRVGIHEDYTRIALDLPSSSRYRLAVAGNNSLVVHFEGLTAPLQAGARVGSQQVNMWQFRNLNGQLALVIEAEHPLSSAGQGFQVGFLPQSEGRAQDVLYLDISAERQGPTVNQLALNDLAPLNTLSTTSVDASDNTSVDAPIHTPADTSNTAQISPPAVRPQQAVTRTVVIDPGHGGRDPGAQGYASEEVVVLDIALRVRDILEAQDIDVILSREGDYHLHERKVTDLAARAAMATIDRNLFVSIHANAAENSSASGVETWVFGEQLDENLIQNAIIENGGGSLGVELTAEAKRVHDNVLNDIFRQEQLYYSLTLAEAIQNAMVETTGARDRGIRKNYFYVLRNARIPAVLVEVGFVSNPEEGRSLARTDYRAKLATSIAEGIVTFFEQEGALVNR